MLQLGDVRAEGYDLCCARGSPLLGTDWGWLSLFLSGWPPFHEQSAKQRFRGKLKNTTSGKTQLDLTIAHETLKVETVRVVKHRPKYGTGEIFGKI